MQPSPQSIQTQLNQQGFSEPQTYAYTHLVVTLELSVARRSYSYHYFNVVKQRDWMLSFHRKKNDERVVSDMPLLRRGATRRPVVRMWQAVRVVVGRWRCDGVNTASREKK
jgi:hypothetical protein